MDTTEPKHWRDILPVHPAADVFPLLPPDELAELAQDIEKNGLREPPAICAIWANDDPTAWYLIDGRNRLDAMESVGYHFTGFKGNRGELCLREPGGMPGTIIVREEHDPVTYIISANIHRRHLGPAERASLAIQAIEAAGSFVEHSTKLGRPQSLAGRVAEIAGVSKKTALEQIAAHADPVLREAVKEKRLSPAKAAAEARRQRLEKARERQRAKIETLDAERRQHSADVSARFVAAAVARCQRDPAALVDVVTVLTTGFLRCDWGGARAEEIMRGWAGS